MEKKVYIILYIEILFLIFSCNRQPEKIESHNSGNKNQNFYAKGFSVIHYNNVYKIITVKNPWQGANNIQFEYYLVDRAGKIPDELKQKPVIRTPVRKVVCLSTTHTAMIDFIDEPNSITGIAGTNNVVNPKIRKQIDEGKIKDVGYDNNLNYETIIGLQPDLVIVYGVGSEASQVINKLRDLNINAVVNAEYLEETVLAKAEWIKFISAFYNKEKLAEEKFLQIEKEYNNLKKIAGSVKEKPNVLTGLPWKGTWWAPGGNSHTAKLIADAGGQFLWAENTSHESIPVNIESVIEKAQLADVWINPGAANSLREIVSVDERIQGMTVFKKAYIYNNNAILNKFGGNDFWESGIMNPQIILKDLIYIFHPALLPDHKLTYYKKLQLAKS